MVSAFQKPSAPSPIASLGPLLKWADADFLVGPTTAKTVDGLQINVLVRLDDDLVVGGSRRVLLEEGRNPTLPRRRTRRSGRWSS